MALRWITYAIVLCMLAFLYNYILSSEHSNPDLTSRVSLGLIAISLVATLGLTLSSIALSDQQGGASKAALLWQKYDKSLDKLSSSHLWVRLDGIFELEELAKSHARTYKSAILRQFREFEQHPPEFGSELQLDQEMPAAQRVDVSAVKAAIDVLVREGAYE